MADKKFTLGCKINVKYRAYYHWETGGEVSYSKEDDLIVWVDWVARNGDIELSKADLSEADPNWYIEDLETLVQIIWHPVMIGDVMYYTAEKRIDIVWSNSSCALNIRDWENSLNLFNFWDNKRAPIDDQSDECIDYVYNLIQKN